MAPGVPARSAQRRGRAGVRWLRAVAGLELFLGLSGVLFIHPPSDRPVRADAIVVLGGNGQRVMLAERLAQEGYASAVYFSTASVPPETAYECTDLRPPPGVRYRCFRPMPFSTQGEARYLGRLAAQHGWHSVLVITSKDQVLRAGVRVERCFHGGVILIAVATPSHHVAYDVLYEWAALAKAEIWQRHC